MTEEMLLTLIGRSALRSRITDRINIIKFTHNSNINWKKLIYLLKKNQSISLVFDQVNNNVKEIIPHSKLSSLFRIYSEMFSYAKLFDEEIADILLRLNSNSINYVLLKNYYYSRLIYRGDYLKPHSDIDLLVKTSDYIKTAKVLFKLGYSHYRNHFMKKGSQSIESLKKTAFKSQEVFRKIRIINNCKVRFLVELHSTIVDTFPYFPTVLNQKQNSELTKELMLKKTKANFNGTTINIFSPTEQLFSLILHSIIQHNMQNFISYFEIAALTLNFSKKINWKYFSRLTSIYGLDDLYAWFFILLNLLFPELPISNLNQKESLKRLRKLEKALLLYMFYKIFHPTKHLLGKKYEREKTICWSIIDKRFRFF